MIKITDPNDRAALKVALSITSKKVVEITPGCVMVRCQSAAVTVKYEHNIPSGRFTYKDYFLSPCEVDRPWPEVIPGPDVGYIGHVPAGPAWQMQMAIAELTGHVLSTGHLKAVSILYKGQDVTVACDRNVMFLNIENITLVTTIRGPVTRVLISGMPVELHQALKGVASERGTSVNKLILEAIKKEVA
ncbi:MAG: hypothetical protein J7K40_09330 [candidate division Zixibacteria bacterium]|nr:hypothetical protein [candidate division Zixibacteria bacterium]